MDYLHVLPCESRVDIFSLSGMICGSDSTVIFGVVGFLGALGRWGSLGVLDFLAVGVFGFVVLGPIAVFGTSEWVIDLFSGLDAPVGFAFFDVGTMNTSSPRTRTSLMPLFNGLDCSPSCIWMSGFLFGGMVVESRSLFLRWRVMTTSWRAEPMTLHVFQIKYSSCIKLSVSVIPKLSQVRTFLGSTNSGMTSTGPDKSRAPIESFVTCKASTYSWHAACARTNSK